MAITKYIVADILHFIDNVESLISNKSEFLNGNSGSNKNLEKILNSKNLRKGIDYLLKLKEEISETPITEPPITETPITETPITETVSKVKIKKDSRIKYIQENHTLKSIQEISDDLNINIQTTRKLYKELDIVSVKKERKIKLNANPKISKVALKNEIRLKYIQENHTTKSIYEITKNLDIDIQTTRKLYKILSLPTSIKKDVIVKEKPINEKLNKPRGRKPILNDSQLKEFISLIVNDKYDAYELAEKYKIKPIAAYQIAKKYNHIVSLKKIPKTSEEITIFKYVNDILKYSSHTTTPVLKIKIFMDIKNRYNIDKMRVIKVLDKYFSDKNII